jgi:hypothetical protein
MSLNAHLAGAEVYPCQRRFHVIVYYSQRDITALTRESREYVILEKSDHVEVVGTPAWRIGGPPLDGQVVDVLPVSPGDLKVISDGHDELPQLHPVVVPQSSQTMQWPETFMRIELHVVHWSPV